MRFGLRLVISSICIYLSCLSIHNDIDEIEHLIGALHAQGHTFPVYGSTFSR